MLKTIPILATLAVLVFAFVSPLAAQESNRIASLGILVFPEYDQPGVLVQYQGELAVADKATLPREISFLVPQGSGVGAACGIKSDGSHTSETWKESDGGDGFTKVTYKLNELNFHIEFYYNPLTGSPTKTMEFRYKNLVPADKFELEIQHPLRATDFLVEPTAPNSHSDKEGFTYHTYSYNQVAADQIVSTKIAYTKSDARPSISAEKTTSTTAKKETAAGFDPNLAVVLGVVVAALGLVGYFVWSRRALSSAAMNVPTHKTSNRVVSRGGFCTACGYAMEAEDIFCAQCGAKRKGIESR